MHIRVTFAATTPNYVSGTYLVNAHNGEMLKDMVQESSLKISEEYVESVKENKTSNFTSLTGTGKDDLGVTRTFGISKQPVGIMRLLITQEDKELRHMM